MIDFSGHLGGERWGWRSGSAVAPPAPKPTNPLPPECLKRSLTRSLVRDSALKQPSSPFRRRSGLRRSGLRRPCERLSGGAGNCGWGRRPHILSLPGRVGVVLIWVVIICVRTCVCWCWCTCAIGARTCVCMCFTKGTSSFSLGEMEIDSLRFGISSDQIKSTL